MSLDDYLHDRRALVDRTLESTLPTPDTEPSLVHDDLPALDNDDLRRGRKTTHVVYGEAMAILTGDALLTEAFSWLSRAGQVKAIEVVAEAINSTGIDRKSV